ncbi:MAG: PHP domain-containing protein, partial [Chloroflexota bacterium]|nr:PHP domain-containing protein [Chloroflexota bacterium]
MKIDLHIHTRTGSDGNLPIEEVFREAKNRGIELISITDHDSIEGQKAAISLAGEHGISYITGVELNVMFKIPGSKSVSLDFLGYRFDPDNAELKDKLLMLRNHREKRARQILENLNVEFDREGINRFNDDDLRAVEDGVDGTFGRPHIADYLIRMGIVKDRQEAFDK